MELQQVQLRLYYAFMRGVHILVEQPLSSVGNLWQSPQVQDIVVYWDMSFKVITWPKPKVMFIYPPLQRFLVWAKARCGIKLM